MVNFKLPMYVIKDGSWEEMDKSPPSHVSKNSRNMGNLKSIEKKNPNKLIRKLWIICV